MAQRGLDQGQVNGVALRVAAADMSDEAYRGQTLYRGAVVSPPEGGERLRDGQRDVADPSRARIVVTVPPGDRGWMP